MIAGHDYLSTACMHGVHGECRKNCRYCGEDCQCPCHPHEPSDRHSTTCDYLVRHGACTCGLDQPDPYYGRSADL